jgi:hypothetical protein
MPEGSELLLLRVLLCLISHLPLDLFKLVSLLRQSVLLLSINLLLQSYHIFLNFFEFLLILVPLLPRLSDSALKLYVLDLFAGQLISQDAQWALLNFLLVSKELAITSFKPVLVLLYLSSESFLLTFKLIFVLLESLLDIEDLLLFACKLSTHLSDLVLELLLELYDAFLSPLQIERLLSQFALECLHALQ